jgi:hypothetical protein
MRVSLTVRGFNALERCAPLLTRTVSPNAACSATYICSTSSRIGPMVRISLTHKMEAKVGSDPERNTKWLWSAEMT